MCNTLTSLAHAICNNVLISQLAKLSYTLLPSTSITMITDNPFKKLHRGTIGLMLTMLWHHSQTGADPGILEWWGCMTNACEVHTKIF